MFGLTLLQSIAPAEAVEIIRFRNPEYTGIRNIPEYSGIRYRIRRVLLHNIWFRIRLEKNGSVTTLVEDDQVDKQED